MKFDNRLFTLSFIISLWIVFLGWIPWVEFWPAVLVFWVGMMLSKERTGGASEEANDVEL